MVCFPFWTLLVARGSFVVWRAHDSHIYLIMVFAVSVRVYLIRIEMCVGIWHFSCNTTLWLMLAVNCTSFWVACRGSCRPFWPRAMWIMGATEKKKKTNALHLCSVSLNCHPLSLVFCSVAFILKQVASHGPSTAFRLCDIKVKPSITWTKNSASLFAL